MRHYISIIILALCLVACNRHSKHWETLMQVETFIVQRPDSALAVLEHINISELKGKEERARYALLYTQAKDKNYIDETDLSLICEAQKYYKESDNVRYRFLSLYYYGRVLCNNSDFHKAIIAYTEAEALLEKLGDENLSGLLYVQIGNIYRITHDYDKCLEAYKSAYNHYSKAKLDSHMAYSLLDIGIAYWNLTDTAIAEEYFTQSLMMAKALNDEYLERICYENLFVLYDEIDENEKCTNIAFELNEKFNSSLFSPVCLASMASYNAKIGDYESIDKYLIEAWNGTQNKSDSIALYFQSANIMKIIGNTDKALDYFEKGINLQNEELRYAMQQPIVSIQKDYFQNQAEYNSYRLKKNLQIYVTLSIIVFLILLIVFMYMRHRFLKKDLEISKYMDLASELQVSIRDKEAKISEFSERISVSEQTHISQIHEMSGHIAELFHKQYELLDKLSNTYYETHGCSKEKESIYEQVKSEINKFANDKKTMAQLERIVNTYKNNVMSHIREEIHSISERDIKLLCYIYAGFSAKSISIFVGETTGNILTRKYRLRNKIIRLNTPNAEIMLQEMP
ncbi:MAG: tetratricopeptide repeat protein [Bacteroidaceae bacterium]|nr:tetratricopeptide repeat protein [Bacteroidaceae bacterium]